MSKSKKDYDLEERTANFAENIIDFCKNIKRNGINRTIIIQLIKSGTSIGANYCEADGAESGKDFKHKIAISKKEAKETNAEQGPEERIGRVTVLKEVMVYMCVH